MRPIHLTIEGLRSFRGPVVIDFTGRDHVAIIGDTGAGKSSILEAMTYALYGHTTFTARANQELMNDTSTRLRVVLRFRVSGDTWEVARTLRRSGGRAGEVGQVRAQLRRLGADGAPQEQVEQVRRVNERIAGLLGLDSDAFLRTVVLPQGRFARLLVEDDPRDRSRILRQVWRTDELEAAGELAAGARQEARELQVRLEQAAAAHPEDPAAHLQGLRAAGDAARQRAESASATEREAAAARDEVRAAREAVRIAEAVAERLRATGFEQAGARLPPIRERARAIDTERAALDRRLADIERQRARIPDDDDGPGAAQVAASLATLDGIKTGARQAEDAATDIRRRAEAAERQHVDARRQSEAAARADEETARHGAHRRPLAEAVEAARERRRTVGRLFEDCGARDAERREAHRRLDAARREGEELAKRVEAAQAAALSTAAALTAAETHLADTRRADAAAAAAGELHPGDECPVCARDLPPDWRAPEAADLHDAERAVESRRTAADDARHRVVDLRARRQGAEHNAAAAAERTGAAEHGFASALGALGDAVGTTLEGPPADPASLLGPFDARCEEAAAVLAEHDEEHRRRQEESRRRSSAAAAALAEAAGADRLAAAARSAGAEAAARLRDARAAVVDAFRPDLDLPADLAELQRIDTTSVVACIRAAHERERVLARRAQERERLAAALRTVNDERSALADRRAVEVDKPTAALVYALQEHRFVLLQALEDLQMPQRAPSALPPEDADRLESHIDALRALTVDLAQTADARTHDAAARAEAARSTLAAIRERLGGDSAVPGPESAGGLDEDDPAGVVDRARAVADEARFEARRAGKAAADFAAILDDVRGLRALLEEVRGRELALGDLADALKPGGFLKWLTLRRSRNLLVHASRMLGEMTGGRYAFVDPGDAEEQWRVLDNESNQPRSPASLSGGEQFVASLALALGMVEMMARSGGRLESIFLDEGFGSLDRNNLDAAVQVLGTVAAGGRMVGVISHVRAVAEQVEHVLAVTRGAAGSQAEWLDDRQRRRFSESDTGLEAAAAMTGLLE